MQNSLAIGNNSDSSTKDENNKWPATVPFSSTNYWYDTDTNSLKSIYGTSWIDNDIYDANYNGAPGEDNYSIAYYVEMYKTELEKIGTEIQDARLLTSDEVQAFKERNKSKIAETSFWYSYAPSGGTKASFVDNEVMPGTLYSSSYSISNAYGVRPVIIVSTSAFGDLGEREDKVIVKDL